MVPLETERGGGRRRKDHGGREMYNIVRYGDSGVFALWCIYIAYIGVARVLTHVASTSSSKELSMVKRVITCLCNRIGVHEVNAVVV